MARQQQTETPRAEGQRHPQQQQGGQSGDATTSAAGAGAGAQSGTVESRGDRERGRQVTREGGAGMRTTGGRSTGAGGALAGRGEQPSLLPALMANPGLMASAFLSNPYGFAQAMSQEMDRLFAGGDYESLGQLGGGGAGRGLTSGGSRGLQQGGRGLGQWTPQMELFQRGNELVVRADLPGLRPEDVQIEIEDGVLTLSGERRQSSEDRQEGFYRSERSYGSFSRSIPLPEGVDEEQVQARFEHGELEVTVPLPQQRSRSRRVQIQSGRGQSATQHSQQGERESGGHGAAQSAGGAQHNGGESGQPRR
jgi:HSP20 family protein